MKTKSLKYKLWVYFAFFALLIILILWMLQIIFMDRYYEVMKIREVEKIATEIKKHYPDFTIDYAPDFRQKIADSWPASIDDTCAREDWNWKNDFDLETMTVEMFKQLKENIYK